MAGAGDSKGLVNRGGRGRATALMASETAQLCFMREGQVHSWTAERRPSPWLVLPQKGNLPVARGIQGLTDELHVVIH